jgi:hypothetical protein
VANKYRVGTRSRESRGERGTPPVESEYRNPTITKMPRVIDSKKHART